MRTEFAKVAVAIHLGVGMLMATGTAFADGTGLEKNTQTVSLLLQYQFAVHKSNTLSATDFGQATRSILSVNAGKSRDLTFALHNDKTTTTFTQKNSDMETEWTDFVLSYRIWWFSPSLMVGSCAIKSSVDDTSIFDALCSTSGAGLKGEMPVGANAVAHFDTMFINGKTTRDITGRNIRVGARADIDAGISLRVLTFLDLNTGYRYRNYSVSVDGSKASEIETGPYFGMNFGLVF
jgi:hypothetical protein